MKSRERIIFEQFEGRPRLRRRDFLLGGFGYRVAQAFGLTGALGFGLVPDLSRACGSQFPLSIAVPQVTGFGHLPLQLTKALDVYPNLGMAVQWHPVASDRQAAQALANGSVQAAAMDFSQVLQLRAQGVPAVAIAVESRCPQLVLGLHPPAKADARSVVLKGKRVGMLAQEGAHMLTFRAMQLAGLNSTDVQVQTFNKADEVLDGYRAVTLDGFCLDSAQVVGLEQRGDVRVLADTRTLRGTVDLYGGPVPGSVLAVLATTAKQNPTVCLALAKGVVQSLKWLQTAGPTDLVRKLPEALVGYDPSLFLAGFEKAREGFSLDGVLSAEAAAAGLVALLRLDSKALSLQNRLSETYQNQFAEAARKTTRA